MGDFLLDMRAPEERADSIEPLRYFPDMEVDTLEGGRLSWLSTRLGALHTPFVGDQGVRVAVSGQLVVDDARGIHDTYVRGGVDAVGPVNGAAVILIDDPRTGEVHLVTDLCGVHPCFLWQDGPVVSSHPDFLARVVGADQAWDQVSLAELLLAGRVTPPHSFYHSIQSVRHNSILTWSEDGAFSRRRFPGSPDQPAFRKRDLERPEQLVEELAGAVQRSVTRRADSRFGRSAVALSGGLDSRLILCSLPRDSVVAVSAFDRENLEFRVAQRIARARHVELIPLPRDFEHYGNAAELAVRMSGGMGDFGSAHFLGFRSRLRELNIDNLITGCYFDYLFKALALDAAPSRWLRRERLTAYRHESYLPHFPSRSPLGEQVRQRLDRAAGGLRVDGGSAGRFRVAALRTFPLFTEGDNMQRVVTQKMIGWQAPATDPEVMAVYRRVRPKQRLNRRLFQRAVQRVCGSSLIPDANTGLPVGAPVWLEGIARYRIALRRRWERFRPSIASQESWPNWVHYVNHSEVVREIWARPNPAATDLFREVFGDPPPERLRVRTDLDCRRVLRMITLKIWLDHRQGIGETS